MPDALIGTGGEEMAKAYVVGSYKGGVGKTTFCSALAYVAALNSNSVIAVDMDFGAGGLDIALGVENTAADNAFDFIKNGLDLDRVAVDAEPSGLKVICSPMNYFSMDEDLDGTLIEEAVAKLKRNSDLVLFDMPAGGGAFFEKLCLCSGIDGIIIVSTDSPTSLRSAEKCGQRLYELSGKEVKLVVNSYDLDEPKNNSSGLLGILENVSLPALAVVPHDKLASKALRSGKPLTAYSKSLAGIAVENAFLRIAGNNVPLFEGIMKKKKRKRYF
jgi:septum site-determining protein MinD